ncbi:hypothetical protein ACJ73_08125 [Blastomyces percursus]|uniref:Uncharacterized protein n=1 Tax=Blastomyces percursus TaxID=1658174 RepID=A0A1J9QK39_9EURO|nr:hypothetical protein ACJ73_08125 [Blastomyces percursus]
MDPKIQELLAELEREKAERERERAELDQERQWRQHAESEVWHKLDQLPHFLTEKLFPSLHQLDYVRQLISPISSEWDLRYYEREKVENQVRAIMYRIYENDELKMAFGLRGSITFESHANLGLATRANDCKHESQGAFPHVLRLQRQFTRLQALFLRAEAERRQAEEREAREAVLRREAEELRMQAEEREAEVKVRSQPTTLEELIKGCHDSFSRPLQVGTPSRSTKGSIPPPTGKYCPTSLRHWSSCPVQLQEIYESVSTYLQPAGKDAPRLFTSLLVLNELRRRYSSRKLQSEKDLEHYERTAVEDHVHDIIAELCKIPDA